MSQDLAVTRMCPCPNRKLALPQALRKIDLIKNLLAGQAHWYRTHLETVLMSPPVTSSPSSSQVNRQDGKRSDREVKDSRAISVPV